MQRRSKVSRRSPKRQTSTWARPAAEFGRNCISLPRTPNSTFSRYRSDVSSSCCPKRWQPMLTISLAKRSRAENGSLRVYTTRFWGEKLADLSKLRMWRKIIQWTTKVRTVQQNFYMDNFLKSIRTPPEAIEIYHKVRDILIKGGFNLTKWITSDNEVKSQIPETDRSTKAVKTFEAEPQSS